MSSRSINHEDMEFEEKFISERTVILILDINSIIDQQNNEIFIHLTNDKQDLNAKVLNGIDSLLRVRGKRSNVSQVRVR